MEPSRSHDVNISYMFLSLPLTISFSGQALSMVHHCFSSYNGWYTLVLNTCLLNLRKLSFYGQVSCVIWVSFHAVLTPSFWVGFELLENRAVVLFTFVSLSLEIS